MAPCCSILALLAAAALAAPSASFMVHLTYPAPSTRASSSSSGVVLSAKVAGVCNSGADMGTFSRADFLSASVAAGTFVLVSDPFPAEARGRATLEQSFDRYTPRIIAGGEFYKTELRSAIASGDWKAIEAATSDPPPRTREDKKKPDAGIAERAAKAGGFSDARVLAACDLFAAAFSDNSISPKTKAMKAEVEKMREVVKGMNQVARLALGEEKSGGGFFGFGSKQPTQTELAQKLRDYYTAGGNAYNQFIFQANDELPIQFKKLPYL